MNFDTMHPTNWLFYWSRALNGGKAAVPVKKVRYDDARWEIVRLEGERWKYRCSEVETPSVRETYLEFVESKLQ